jgi:serine/threonine-protein kinase
MEHNRWSKSVMGNQTNAYQSHVVGGRYLLGPPLGRGGMAEVRQSQDQNLERPVAIKILRADLASNPALRARFEGEARSAARLRHPHVVSVFDTGEDDGVPFIVMELLPGDTLADRIRSGPLAEATVRRLASQVLGALDAAHSAGILHRDVKPANILFDSDGTAKVGDFGIAKSMEAEVETDLTTTGDVLGTPAYVAPERAEGKAATAVSDLWSLGVVLYEALTRRRPFSGDSAFAAALAARQGSITPLSSLRPDLSARMVQVVERALSPDPADRFASAADMATALGVGLAGAGPNRRLADRELTAVGETGLLTATLPLPPEDAALSPATQRLHAEPGPSPIEAKAPGGAHRKKRRSRTGRWDWLAAGTAALVTLVALAASGALSGSSAPATTGHGSTGSIHAARTHSGASTTAPVTTAPPPSLPATTAPPTTAPPPTPPATTAPPTTAPPPGPPATTAPSETSPASNDGGNPHGGGQGDQGGGHGHQGGQGH